VGVVVDVEILAGAIAASVVFVVLRPTWRIVRYPVTAVHEFGHLVVALAVGGRGARVRLRADSSGLTTWRASGYGRGRAALIALAGPARPRWWGRRARWLSPPTGPRSASWAWPWWWG
jgi:hypothetical protein